MPLSEKMAAEKPLDEVVQELLLLLRECLRTENISESAIPLETHKGMHSAFSSGRMKGLQPPGSGSLSNGVALENIKRL